MLTRVRPTWRVRNEADPAVIKSLAQSKFGRNGIRMPRAVCRVLAKRGYTTVEAVNKLLTPSLSELHSPALFKDIEKAVARLKRAFETGERILIVGDYDVDGVTSSAILVKGFNQVLALTADRGYSLDMRAYIPHRTVDGFGLSEKAVDAAIDDGRTLILTCDNGVAAHQNIAKAAKAGVDVIVTDHHDTPQIGVPPDAVAVVNPNQPGCEYPFKKISGAVVAWKVLQAFMTHLELPQKERAAVMMSLIDLTALGLICDVMPIVDENRVIVRAGLKVMAQSQHIGLRLLLAISRMGADKLVDFMNEMGSDSAELVRSLSDVQRLQVKVDDCGFGIGPRLNASGRLYDAETSYRCLMEENAFEALKLALRLNAVNRERQALVATMQDECMEMLAEMGGVPENGIVLRKSDWHIGVVGITAGRLTEMFQVPSFVMGEPKEGVWKGSGRSPEGTVHLKRALEAPDVAASVVKAGGHAEAAGVTVDADSYDAFVEAFQAECDRQLEGATASHGPSLVADLQVTLSECTQEVVTALDFLEPFGKGNPRPLFYLKGLEIISAKSIGRSDVKHLKLVVRDPEYPTVRPMEFLWWRNGDKADRCEPGRMIDVIGRIELNEFNGTIKTQVVIEDAREAITNEDL